MYDSIRHFPLLEDNHFLEFWNLFCDLLQKTRLNELLYSPISPPQLTFFPWEKRPQQLLPQRIAPQIIAPTVVWT